MNLQQIRLDVIEVAERLRPLDEGRLERLVCSFLENGQMTPIEVVAQDGARPYRLVAGRHRMAAAERAGLQQIWAVVTGSEATEPMLRLREIDENLARVELSAYDRANFIAERARLWEQTNGQIGPGNNATKARKKVLAQVAPHSGFAAEVCQKFGLSADDVKRDRARFGRICPAVWAALKGTTAADIGAVLDAFARLAPDVQAALLERLQPSLRLPATQFKRAFRVAHAALVGGPAAAKTDQQCADELLLRFRRLTPAAQEMFRAAIRRSGRAQAGA